MKRPLSVLLFLVWVFTSTLAVAAERWVHVRVIENGKDGEKVRINIPLSLAEKVLPTINVDKLHDGRIRVEDRDLKGVDLRALLDAVREAPDNEYVTVDSPHENVRVAKSGGFMLIKVREAEHKVEKAGKSAEIKPASTVDIKVPFTVVNALLSGEKDELNLVAAVQALNQSGDIELVTVNDEHSNVRIWVDSQNVAE
jgi:hypothetical protein